MHVASAFDIFHDSFFLPVKRASAHAISCLRTVAECGASILKYRIPLVFRIAQPVHCMSAGQFPNLALKFLCERALCLKNCLGSMLA